MAVDDFRSDLTTNDYAALNGSERRVADAKLKQISRLIHSLSYREMIALSTLFAQEMNATGVRAEFIAETFLKTSDKIINSKEC